MHLRLPSTPTLGDPHSVFAAAYGAPVRTRALAGCILRQYEVRAGLLSVLFNDGVCIALHHANCAALDAGSGIGAMLTRLRANDPSLSKLVCGRHGWMLAARCCPLSFLEALDDAAQAEQSSPVAVTA